MTAKKRNVKLKGRLKSFTQTSLYMGFLLVAVNMVVYLFDVSAGLVVTCFALFYFAITLLMLFYNKPIIMNELVSFATQYGQIQKVLLRELELPYAVLDEDGRIIWTNAGFENVVHRDKDYRKSITSLFPSITREKLPSESSEAELDLTYEGRNYMVKMKRISMKEMAENSDIIDSTGYTGSLIAFYLFDETALRIALQEVDDQSLVVGMIYLDNYEEALESVEEVRRSLLTALIDRKVNKYISAIDGICKKEGHSFSDWEKEMITVMERNPYLGSRDYIVPEGKEWLPKTYPQWSRKCSRCGFVEGTIIEPEEVREKREEEEKQLKIEKLERELKSLRGK